jgi:hypothetical protein
MSLGKRHIGRRVAGVGVAVALMVLGLQAPAFATVGITSFTPVAGPAGCIVVITGTDFLDPPVSDVEFNNLTVGATGFSIISDTELWAQVPATATDGLISVERAATAEDVSSTAEFNVSASGCEPTIASFTPTCGLVGTTVTITGTNLLNTGFAGGTVEFAPFDAAGLGKTASHTGASEDPTSLSVLVPAAAGDGKIQVTTAGGNVFSTASFDVVTDTADCVAVGPTTHARSISFKIKKTGKASGLVSSTEDPAFTDCVAAVPVKIQRKKNGAWKTVGKTTTTDTGSYTKKVKNPKGKQKFRALAPKVSLGDPVTDACLKAKSAVRKI